MIGDTPVPIIDGARRSAKVERLNDLSHVAGERSNARCLFRIARIPAKDKAVILDHCPDNPKR